MASLNNVSLQYDAFGRRIQNIAGKSFLYDGANATQELSGGTVLANLVSGGVDEVFTRADSAGTFTQLKDALGSTIALVDAAGNVQTTYSYDPFGNTSSAGATNANGFQYTGRENEGNGLYFYRARYYSPVLHRFISQDPLGFAGSGPNLYAYAGNSPTNFTDPFGLQDIATGPVTTPYVGNPTAAQVEEALQSVKNATQAAEAAPSLLQSLEGPSVIALGTADAQLLATEIETVNAINGENAAYDAEMQSIILYNQAMMMHPRPLPLAGRYTADRKPGGGGDDNDDCDKEWRDAAEYCSQLDDIPRNSKLWTRELKKVFGGSILKCMFGQVSQRCGGNKVDW